MAVALFGEHHQPDRAAVPLDGVFHAIEQRFVFGPARLDTLEDSRRPFSGQAAHPRSTPQVNTRYPKAMTMASTLTRQNARSLFHLASSP